MTRGGFSKKAKRHAATSARDKKRQLALARKPSPVTVSWLPGHEPAARTFEATIVGHPKGPYRVRVHDYGMEFLGWLDK